MIFNIKNTELYNNIMKKRKLLLESSAKDILRFAAAKQTTSVFTAAESLEKLGISEGSVKIQKYMNNIGEEHSIKEIITALYKDDLFKLGGKVTDEVDTIFDKNFLNGQTDKFSVTRKSGGEEKNENDIKDLVGYDYIDGFAFNNTDEPPNKLTNPYLSIFKLYSNASTFKKAEVQLVSIFMNMIPAVEMSKCVPHLDVKIIDDKGNNTSKIALSKFLVGGKVFENDSFAQGLANVDVSNVNDVIFNAAKGLLSNRNGNGSSQSVSGMELFTSPQTLVNSDINKFNNTSYKVIDKFRPFMSIESVAMKDYLVGYRWLSATDVSMTIKLYDRSRLGEIERLVAPEQLGAVSIALEFGWSHPDGGITSKNPYGQFLNGLKRRGLYKIYSSNVAINDDGTATVSLSLISLPADSFAKSSVSSKFITVDKLNEYLGAVQQILKEKNQKSGIIRNVSRIVREVNAERRSNDLVLLKSLGAIKFFEQIDKILNNPAADDIDVKIETLSADLLDLLGTKAEKDTKGSGTDGSKEENKIAKLGIEDILSKLEGNISLVGPSHGSSLSDDSFSPSGTVWEDINFDPIDESGAVLAMPDYGTVDPVETDTENPVKSSTAEFLKQRYKITSPGVPDISLANALVGSDNKTFGASTITRRLKTAGVILNDISIPKDYISIGKLVTAACLIPMLNDRKSDEIQTIVSCANKYAGAANGVSLFDVFISKTEYNNALKSKLLKSKTGTIRIGEEIDIISDILSSDSLLAYGVSKSGSKQQNNEVVKENDTKTDADEELKDVRTEILSKIYASSDKQEDKELIFKKIRLAIKVEAVPVSFKGSIKRTSKIFIYDKNAEDYNSHSLLIKSLGNSEIVGLLNGNGNSINSNPIVRRFTSLFNKKGLFNIKGNNLTKLLSGINIKKKGVLTADEQSVVRDISQFVVDNVDSIMKSELPTIEFGGSSCNVESISINSETGGIASEYRQYMYASGQDNNQDIGTEKKVDTVYINPASVTMTVLGCPIINIAQEFYITSGTKTSLDNIYRVTNVSHNIAQGVFKTTVNLVPANATSTKSILNNIIKISKYL